MTNDSAALWLHQAIVRPEWVDYNNHLSEAFYVLIFGDATDAFYDHIGLDDLFRRANAMSVYTLEGHIRYLREAKLGQELRIATRVTTASAKKLRLHHTMQATDEKTIFAVSEISALCVGTNPVVGAQNFPETASAKIQAYQLSHQNSAPPLPAMSPHWLGG
jgi:acyl-CoA thioester hydrolase